MSARLRRPVPATSILLTHRIAWPRPPETAAANFVSVSILEPVAGTELEIELTNACVLRLKGAIDPLLLQAAITAAGRLDGSREGVS